MTRTAGIETRGAAAADLATPSGRAAQFDDFMHAAVAHGEGTVGAGRFDPYRAEAAMMSQIASYMEARGVSLAAVGSESEQFSREQASQHRIDNQMSVGGDVSGRGGAGAVGMGVSAKAVRTESHSTAETNSRSMKSDSGTQLREAPWQRDVHDAALEMVGEAWTKGADTEEGREAIREKYDETIRGVIDQIDRERIRL